MKRRNPLISTYMEKSHRQAVAQGTATLFLGAAACLYWGLYYPHHLHYQEQLQLFLLTPEYWAGKIAHPGGVAEYVAEFLTQFFYFAWAGASIIAVLLMILQKQLHDLGKSPGTSGIWFPISFIPSLLLWIFLCDENALLSLPVSMILSLTALQVYRRIKHPYRQVAYALLAMPLLYWIAGGAYLLFVCGIIPYRRGNKPPYWLARSLAYLLLGILYPILAQGWAQYPLSRLFLGIDYYRFPTIFPGIMIATICVTAILLWIAGLLPDISKRRSLWRIALCLLIAAGGGSWIYAVSDSEKEEVMRYDYLARMRQWGEIIRTAERKEPKAPISVACLNLALAKTGQLGDRMFHFYQNGTEGLIASFQRDFMVPLSTNEVFYHLGMINSSQRYTFEAMEAIPDFKKSGRAYVRLVETNLINGEYAVATKYLQALRQTLFYRRWANQVTAYLYDEEKINSHPEWGWLRKARYTEDFLFSETEMDSMLGLLLRHNPKNRMAFEYLLAHALLRKDLERFMRYYPLGKELGYDHIPLSFQEALIFVWTQENSSFQGLPWSISRSVLDGVSEFARIYTTQPDAESLLRPKYEKTFWYYLLFRK